MTRKPMQDIVPKDRSIRNVPVSDIRTKPKPKPLVASIEKEAPKPRATERRSPKTEEIREIAPRIEEDLSQVSDDSTLDKRAIRHVREEFESHGRARKKRGKRTKKIAAIVGAVILVFLLAAGISGFFNSATLTITPHTMAATIADDLTAKKSASQGLSYQIISIKETGSETVRANGQEKVNEKAGGTIVIYNNYSSAAQRLIKNTRFQTPEGLIFRITDSVTVPGKKGTTPGSVDAAVIADEPGESYNVGLKDFTIPGFKGDPRYTTFYARSKTQIAGGFSGMVKIISDADRKKAQVNIESKVTAQLLSQIASQVPSDKVTFPKAYTIEFKNLPEESVGEQAVIKKEGTLSVVVFDRKMLSMALAEDYVKGYANEPIIIPDVANLTFAPKGEWKPVALDTIAFTLSGKANFEWLFDELSLKQALLGQTRSSVPSVLQKFPMIEKADISLKPFWSRKFPETMDKITVLKAS